MVLLIQQIRNCPYWNESRLQLCVYYTSIIGIWLYSMLQMQQKEIWLNILLIKLFFWFTIICARKLCNTLALQHNAVNKTCCCCYFHPCLCILETGRFHLKGVKTLIFSLFACLKGNSRHVRVTDLVWFHPKWQLKKLRSNIFRVLASKRWQWGVL